MVGRNGEEQEGCQCLTTTQKTEKTLQKKNIKLFLANKAYGKIF